MPRDWFILDLVLLILALGASSLTVLIWVITVKVWRNKI